MREHPANEAPYRLLNDVSFGRDVVVQSFTNLYGCTIGDETKIGPFVEIQRDVVVGARCKISSHSFICTGVEIEDEVFINDRRPRSTTDDGSLQTEDDWTLERTVIARGASLGTGAVVMCGVRVGERAIVGAGAVVTSDVPDDAVVVGTPARERAVRAAVE
jgi:UDP-2-acetamido-3-amino-2,3-dideoxy-glucuronate N-acetyltransferase